MDGWCNNDSNERTFDDHWTGNILLLDLSMMTI